MQWDKQVAVVTGAARGIGRATAQLLAQRGAAVCVNYAKQAEQAQALVGELRAAGAHAIAVAADVADAKAVDAMIAQAEAELGPITILVNNAGVAVKGTLDTYDRDVVARMRAINVEGVINATRAAAAGMRKRRHGRIVNIASIAALGTAMPGNAFYAGTKAEVAILTKRFAMELGGEGITVNAIAPGYVRSDMTTLNNADFAATEKRLSAVTMLGRIGEPEDIANAVAFLAAPESSWITAQMIVIDGGRMDYIGHG